MKFSLVHPSRQRLERAESALREWHGAASGNHPLEHIISVDTDDPNLDGYRALAARHGATLVVSENRRMVQAMNRGAEAATGDVIVGMSDDFGCPANWDEAIAAAIGDRREAALFVHDGLDGRIMTLPILTRAFYRRIGFVYNPLYISMFVDDDLTELSRVQGATIDARSTLVFPHRHVSHDLAPLDATYSRQNSNRSWWHGWRTFERRRIDNFGERAPGFGPAIARLRIDAYYYLRTGGARLRRVWLRWLPDSWRDAEYHARSAALRAVARLTSMRIRD